MTYGATPLGRLERVDLRDYWLNEASHFTPWLAREENVALLGEAIGIDLEVQQQEANVGPFRADILCRNTANSSLVLVENQLARTDHTHLGQLFTYAAGLDAVTVIWVAAQFTEEHRAALDWLNDITHEGFNFFGLEIELWRIGDSVAAPKFNIVSQPNDWTRSIRETTGGVSEHQQFRRRFWKSFLDHLANQKSHLAGRRTPSSDYWLDFGIGRSHFALSCQAGFRDGWIAALLVIGGDEGHAHYHLLEAQRPAIEGELGEAVIWDFDPNRRQSHVKVLREALDPTDESQWPEIHEWLRLKAELLDRVFRPKVRTLDAGDWRLEEENEVEAPARVTMPPEGSPT